MINTMKTFTDTEISTRLALREVISTQISVLRIISRLDLPKDEVKLNFISENINKAVKDIQEAVRILNDDEST